MNRIMIAVVMVLIAGLICGCEIYSVSSYEKSYTEELAKVSKLMESKEYSEAGKLSENILKNWKKTAKHLDKYLYHDYIDSITEHLVTLPAYTESKDETAVRAHIEEIKIQLTSLKESELPYLHNIL